jgi:hypothetical protein
MIIWEEKGGKSEFTGKAFCNAYNAAAGSSGNNLQPGAPSQQASSASISTTRSSFSQQTDAAHCDQKGNPYKPGTKQYDDYQAGLDDAMKAGRDCDKMIRVVVLIF